MKLFIKGLYLMSLIILLAGCQSTPIIEETPPLSEAQIALESKIPLSINASFELPSLIDHEITFEFENQVIEDVFIYEAPFFDQTIDLNITVQNGNVTESFTVQRTLVAPDSANNISRIDVYTPEATFDIPRDRNMRISFKLTQDINGEMTDIIDTEAARIRGRGNSTWGMPKKPYRIRFDEAVSLLGLPETRTYVLLAEYADKSLLRNTIVHKFSSQLEHLDHTISTRVVELYINDVYQGLYVFTEQVELAEEKLFFETVPGVLDTGYFLELDQRFFDKGGIEGLTGFVVEGYPYEIVRPDPEDKDYLPEQTAFIKAYFEDLEAALMAKHGYEDYIDVDNWIDFFIVQELFKNVDVGWSSVNIYKRPGDVVRLGPLWDFDLAIGNADYIDYQPENWYGMRRDKNRWFMLMMDVPTIRERFKIRYKEVYEEILPPFMAELETLYEAKAPYAERNFQEWDILSIYVWPNPPGMLERNTYRHQFEYVKNFIQTRADWMYNEVQSSKYAAGRFNP